MENVAQEIANRLVTGDIIGVGTGSTVARVLESLGQILQSQNKIIFGITTSMQSSQLCQSVGILPIDPAYIGNLTLGFDGADEVDSQLRLIKGKGAAMLREKIVAVRCSQFLVVADEGKLVNYLGERCAVPVEVIPTALEYVEKQLLRLGANEVKLRDGMPGKHGPVVTELGNLILDARFLAIPDSLERDIKSIVGVVESGLFLKTASEVLILKKSGDLEIRKR